MTDSKDVVIDQIARSLCAHYGVTWAGILPGERDQWRAQVDGLLDYLDGTAFQQMAQGMARRERLHLGAS